MQVNHLPNFFSNSLEEPRVPIKSSDDSNFSKIDKSVFKQFFYPPSLIDKLPSKNYKYSFRCIPYPINDLPKKFFSFQQKIKSISNLFGICSLILEENTKESTLDFIFYHYPYLEQVETEQTLNKIKSTLIKTQSIYILCMLLYIQSCRNPRSSIESIVDQNFGTVKMQNTMELIGKILMNKNAKDILYHHKQAHICGFIINKTLGEVYIRKHLIARGGIKKILLLSELVQSKDYIQASIKDPQSIEKVMTEHTNLQKLHEARIAIPGLIPPYNFFSSVMEKNLTNIKSFLVQVKLEADCLSLIATRPSQLLPVLIDITRTLAGMHENGFIHSDVKPANMLYQTTPEPSYSLKGFLCDFGLLTQEGIFTGATPHYTSPELLSIMYIKPTGVTNFTQSHTEQKVPSSELSPFVTIKIDSFSLGVSIIQLLLNKNIAYINNKYIYYGLLSSEQLNEVFTGYEKIIENKYSLLTEKHLAYHLFDLAKCLMRREVDKRITCQEALTRLTLFVNNLNNL